MTELVLSSDGQNCLAQVDIFSPSAGTPIPGQSAMKPFPAPGLPNPANILLTHLWSYVQENQQEILQQHVQKDIKRLHGVIPSAAKPKRPNVPGTYDPLKVCTNYIHG